MGKYYDITGIITDLKRLNCSVNGNPRFMIVLDGISLVTKSDYSYCYNIENLYNKGCKVIAKCYDTKNSSKIETIEEIKG